MKTMQEVTDKLHDICLNFRAAIDDEYFHAMEYYAYIALSDICDEMEEVHGELCDIEKGKSQLLPTEKPTER